MRGGDYCKDCLSYPYCKDLDNDTEVFECDLKVTKESNKSISIQSK